MIVAVCGLHGGSGTTTLAILLARAAARQAPGGVLLCELSSAGSLADSLASASPYDLAQLADLVAHGRRPEHTPWIDLDDGLRVLARPPRTPTPIPKDALEQVLADAEAAHELVVVDAAVVTGAPAAHVALAAATQVVWTIDATASTSRCARLLSSDVCASARDARWLLGASATGRDGANPSPEQLAALHPSLIATVLVPRLGHLREGDPSRELSGLQLLDVLR